MKRTTLLSLWLAAFGSGAFAQNQAPVVSNVQAIISWSSQSLSVQYDVSDAENDPLEVWVEISANDGFTYALTAQAVFSGDVGTGIVPGNQKSVQVDLSAITPDPAAKYRVRVVADDLQPLDLPALVDEVDSMRLIDDLAFIEGIRHRNTGALHLNAVRDSMQALWKEQGLHTGRQTWSFGNYTAQNMIATQRGLAASEQVVVIDAHYDTVNNSPGADDNGSGVAGVWEAARVLHRYPSKKSIRYISFDLEESGLLGSIRYVSNGIPSGEQIIGVLNYEMIGYYSEEPNSQNLPAGFNLLFPDAYNAIASNQFRGDFISNVGNVNSAPLANLYNASAAAYVPGLKVNSILVAGNGTIAPDLRRSDHAPFWDAGYQALMLTDGANFRNECYHTPQDTASDKLSFTFMSNVVKASVATAAQLAELLHGGWATAAFDSPSSAAADLPSCQYNAYMTGAFLALDMQSCGLNKVQLRLFDANGREMWSVSRKSLAAGLHLLEIDALPSGVYVLSMAAEEGQWSQRLVLR